MPNGNPEIVQYMENRTFDEILVGDSASLQRTLTKPRLAKAKVTPGQQQTDAQTAKKPVDTPPVK